MTATGHKTVQFGQATARFAISTASASGGLIAPDAVPIVTNVQVGDSDAAESVVTITQAQDNTPANVPGAFTASVDLSATGLNSAVNDTIMIRGTTSIASVLRPWQMTIDVVASSTDTPQVLVG